MMPFITEIDPNQLFSKVKNQFLAAIIGIIILVVSAITLIVSGNDELGSFHVFGIAALIVVLLISCAIVLQLNGAAERARKANEDRDQYIVEASHSLWRLIVGLGEECLKSDIPDKQRVFVSDALSQVIENELDVLGDENSELRAILMGIKKSLDSDISQNRTFSMVLSQSKET